MLTPIRQAVVKQTIKPKLYWLDLQGSGLSVIERLCLEEALLRHDHLKRSIAIVGTHDPIYQTRLQISELKNRTVHPNTIIVMGIGGKPVNLLNMKKVKDDNVAVVKRFSGGGTVALDHSSLWTTFIGRTSDFPDVQPYPKSIMEWSATSIFSPVFRNMGEERNSTTTASLSKDVSSSPSDVKSLIMDTSSCGMAMGSGQTKSFPHSSSSDQQEQQQKEPPPPQFKLRENDYVLGERKMGGNAQSIVKDGWLHHTSFLWDYDMKNMEYLTLPNKRPDYRGDRDHDDFLVRLKTHYGTRHMSTMQGTQFFFQHVRAVADDQFDVEEMDIHEAMNVVDKELGGMQKWFDGKCRTHLITI